MWGLALAIVIVQRDLGAALLYFLRLPGAAVRGHATRLVRGPRPAAVPRPAASCCTRSSRTSRTASTSGSTRSPIRRAPATRSSARCTPTVAAASLGTGLGAGLPQVGSVPSIPAIHTDFVFAALAEEMGMLGALGVLGLYVLIAQRGFRIAAHGRGRFPGAAGHRPDAGHRHPGRDHRRRQPARRAADRHHAAARSATAARRSWSTARSSGCCWRSATAASSRRRPVHGRTCPSRIGRRARDVGGRLEEALS